MQEQKRFLNTNDILYRQMQENFNYENENSKKIEEFKERIKPFKDIKTLAEAKNLAKKILPISNEITRFNVGNAKCIIINREDNFRICLDCFKEFIAYDFV